VGAGEERVAELVDRVVEFVERVVEFVERVVGAGERGAELGRECWSLWERVAERWREFELGEKVAVWGRE